MRKLFVAAATVAIFALLVFPLTGKGGNGNGKGGGGSTTNPDSRITIEDYSELWLGGTVGFETNAVGLAGREYPMYTVWCYQDLNGNGIHQ